LPKFELKLAELCRAWRDKYGDDYAFLDEHIAFINRKKGKLPPDPHQIAKGDAVSTETKYTCDPTKEVVISTREATQYRLLDNSSRLSKLLLQWGIQLLVITR